MLKKVFLITGLLIALVAAGCSQSGADEENESNGQETQENESAENNGDADEKAVKSALLKTQMNLAEELRPHHSKIAGYEAMKADEENQPEEEELQAAGEEAQAAAGEAVSAVESFEVSEELPETMKEEYNSALDSLKAYYDEAQSALKEAPEEADLSGAQENFDQFQEKLDSVYEEAGLLPVNMSSELS
ncbi:hypothetical protein GCM10007216_32290 [Thalassobacillus devorans]|uniref:Lipoprotein n=1 Tax=Thalassobacillus devorans TaxID=279813 RepID=A0ABQ1PL71_9BACI|nr:hypothetical protein [Thalassobacillus devorans]NIK30190.1 putative nuclease with TOPRIM domain [Thalassobacillus devorans]GGC99035.1 hypothetical protein GCM10007216_32290 [Thalassobacillus devorans]